MLGVALALSTLAFVPACETDEPPTAISRDEYIELHIAILRAAAEERDSAAAAERAAVIIVEHGFTAADLLEFAQQHTDDPGYLADVWGEIEMRLREEPEDTTDSG